jgi:hypothetical protein
LGHWRVVRTTSMGKPNFFTVEKTSIPQASIDGRARSECRHVFSWILHSRQKGQEPAPRPKAFQAPRRKISRSNSAVSALMFTLLSKCKRAARRYESRTLRISSGVGVKGGQTRHWPKPSQPNWHFNRTQAAVSTSAGEIIRTSKTPRFCFKIPDNSLSDIVVFLAASFLLLSIWAFNQSLVWIRNISTILLCPCWPAKDKAVLPLLFLAFTLAPPAMSSLTISVRPSYAARCNGVKP